MIFFFVDLDHPMPHDGRLSNLHFPFVTESQASLDGSEFGQKNEDGRIHVKDDCTIAKPSKTSKE